jgi:hypothetical protein
MGTQAHPMVAVIRALGQSRSRRQWDPMSYRSYIFLRPAPSSCSCPLSHSPSIFTIKATRRKAARPATALTTIVTRNSLPSARFFGAIIGRASITLVSDVTGSNRAVISATESLHCRRLLLRLQLRPTCRQTRRWFLNVGVRLRHGSRQVLGKLSIFPQ